MFDETMRAFLLSLAPPDTIELIGFWILVAGLLGELGSLIIPAARARLVKVVTALSVVTIVARLLIELPEGLLSLQLS